jgi:hypothetical protein
MSFTNFSLLPNGKINEVKETFLEFPCIWKVRNTLSKKPGVKDYGTYKVENNLKSMKNLHMKICRMKLKLHLKEMQILEMKKESN